ncbi:hypothetical protein KKF34_09620 [Myxococcota bacterium]|nr:hypothetical protein [Myxococcota bacterium]MBU1497122.1 hypothetical protein [Myxococcota bacterium]
MAGLTGFRVRNFILFSAFTLTSLGFVSTSQGAVFNWTISSWSECTAVCGGGTQTRTVVCVDGSGNIVSDTLCGNPKPVESQVCNTDPCNYSWGVSPWSECSTSCGEGTQTRDIYCIWVDTMTLVDDSMCLVATRPAETQVCTGTNCAYAWVSESWSACSQVCGEGTQNRNVMCVESASGNSVDESNCTDPKPVTEQICTGTECTYSWAVSEWSDCSEECGGGVAYRDIYCIQYETNTLVHSDLCDPLTIPAEEMDCNTDPCPGTYTWAVGEWGECEALCLPDAPDAQTREVYCIETESNTLVENDLCDLPSRPEGSQDCESEDPCPEYDWEASGWSVCTEGIQTRTVSCNETTEGTEVTDSLCDSSTKPAETQECTPEDGDSDDDGGCSASGKSRGSIIFLLLPAIIFALRRRKF